MTETLAIVSLAAGVLTMGYTVFFTEEFSAWTDQEYSWADCHRWQLIAVSFALIALAGVLGLLTTS